MPNMIVVYEFNTPLAEWHLLRSDSSKKFDEDTRRFRTLVQQLDGVVTCRVEEEDRARLTVRTDTDLNSLDRDIKAVVDQVSREVAGFPWRYRDHVTPRASRLQPV